MSAFNLEKMTEFASAGEQNNAEYQANRGDGDFTIADGQYTGVIKEAEIKTSKAGNSMLAMRIALDVDGEEKLKFENLVLEHDNEKVVQINWGKVSRLFEDLKIMAGIYESAKEADVASYFDEVAESYNKEAEKKLTADTLPLSLCMPVLAELHFNDETDEIVKAIKTIELIASFLEDQDVTVKLKTNAQGNQNSTIWGNN